MTAGNKTALLEDLLGQRILLLDGAMGTMIQAHGLDEAAFRGERLADWPTDLKGNNDLLTLTRPDIIGDIHAAFLDAGADIVETNTFNSTAVAQADYGMEDVVFELNREGRRAGPRRRRRRRDAGPPALRCRRPRADQPHRLHLARRQRSGPAQRHLRRAGPGLRRGGAGPRRRRRRHSAYRDGVRHPQLQGRHLCRRALFRRPRRALAGDDLGHHHRRFRAHAFGPDAGGILECRRPRAAAFHRPQLRARRRGPQAPRAGAGAHRRGAGQRPSQRRPSQCLRRLRRHPRLYGRAPEGIRRKRLRQHRRRLLWHDARPHPGHRRGGGGRGAQNRPRDRAALSAQRPRAPDIRPRNRLRQCRRAHQRRRLGTLQEADPGRRLHGGAGGGEPAGDQRRPGHRRQHGRGDAGFRGGDGDLPQAGRRRARHRPRADHDRFVQVVGHRGRPQVRPRQGHRQLDQPQGGRGGLRRPGARGPALRRRRRRHGLRREGPSRQPPAQGGDLRSRLPHPDRGRGLPARGTSSSIPTSSPSPPASRNTTTTASTSSRRPRRSSSSFPMPWCRGD